MTLASWFTSMPHFHSRLTPTGARRYRSRAFHRRTSLEALEDRRLLSGTVSFTQDSETVNESAGAFNIPVTVSGITPNISDFASGFVEPSALAFDAAGNLYVASDGDDTVKEVSPAGVLIQTISGFDDPQGLAFDAAGDLYVANGGNNTVSVLSPTGGTGGTWGAAHTFASGFQDPIGLAFDSAGNLYVANAYDSETDSYGTTVSEVPKGSETPVTFASGLHDPGALAFDAAGNLYVADAVDNAVSEVSPAGELINTISGFHSPEALAFDAAGNLYVANFVSNNAVSEVSPAGVVTAFADASAFNTASGLAFDAAGNLYVSSYEGNAVSKLSETVSVPFTLGGTAVSGTTVSGITASPLVFGIGHTTLDITGTLLSVPGPSQTLTVTLGTPAEGFSLGSPSVNTLTITEPGRVQFSTGSETVNEATGTFSIPVTLSSPPSAPPVVSPFASGLNDPYAVAFDAAGNLYVANYQNGSVSEVPPGGGLAKTFAAGFDNPTGLAFDSAGNLYVADGYANTVYVVPPGGGVAKTFATGFADPWSLAFDTAGNLYVANEASTTVSVVPPAGGLAKTFAAGFDNPTGLAFDDAGNLYVANAGDDKVSEVPVGSTTPMTFASGFQNPAYLAFDSTGNLYVANTGNNTVYEVTPAGVVSSFASGFDQPTGLALVDGRLYVNDAGTNTMSLVTQTLAVPFALGDTAAEGAAYSGVTAGLLTFGIGQTTARHYRKTCLRSRPHPDADIHPGHAHGGRRPGQYLRQHADHQRAGFTHTNIDRVRVASCFSGRAASFFRQGKA